MVLNNLNPKHQIHNPAKLKRTTERAERTTEKTKRTTE
jgi:hypothetical protein